MKGMRRGILIGIPLLAGFVAVAQKPMSRFVEMKKLAGYVGKWKIEGIGHGPPEFGDPAFHGTMSVDWALNKTALEFKATVEADDVKGAGPLVASGILAFNEEASYEKQGFNGSFAWSQDGRMLPLHGNFVGKTLVLEGTPGGWDKVNFRVKATDGDIKKWDVFVFEGKDERLFCQFKISK